MNYSRRSSFMSFGIGAFTAAIAMAVMALSSFSATAFDYGATRHDDPWAMSAAYSDMSATFLSALAEVGYVAVMPLHEELNRVGVPRSDVHYASISQIDQRWRFAVDTYRHIDPGRRLAI